MKKVESSFTFVTLKLFFHQKKLAHFQIRPQMAHNIDSKKPGQVGKNWGFSGKHRISYTYQQKSKSMSSPEHNYQLHFALRYPAGNTPPSYQHLVGGTLVECSFKQPILVMSHPVYNNRVQDKYLWENPSSPA